MAWNSNLTGSALRIAASNENPLRVMAGPGTGKSFAMQRRVARLLEQDLVPPGRILAVTFTRNAAASLVIDLNGMGVAGSDGIWCGTLHGYCFGLLGRQNVFTYLGRIPRPLITFNSRKVAQFECAPLLEDLSSAGPFGAGRECTKRIREFEAAWARLQHDDPGWPADPVDRDFQAAIESWLKFHEAMLIGELVPEALRFLRNNPATEELMAFDHVIVDEYQDLNKAEQVLLDVIGSNANLSIVGDVDQSIYSFRYAHPEGIGEFSVRHPATHDEPLQECRRCPKLVVKLADRLIRYNHVGAGNRRLSERAENIDGEVRIVQWDSLLEEARGLARYVGHLINNHRIAPGEIIVLSPRRRMGYSIRTELQRLNVPAHSFYHEEALEPDEAQAAFTLLNLLVNPTDRVSLRYWLGLGSPSWRSGEYARLRAHCENSGQSPLEVLQAIVDGNLTLGRTRGIQARYRELLTQLATLAPLDCPNIINSVFPADENWAASFRQLSLSILDGTTTPGELLNELRDQITQPEMPESGEFVRIMSLHKSKGLTCKVAIIPGCIEGLIPNLDADDTPAQAANNLQEQRRLFYVAITRCTEILVLSSVLRIPRDEAHRLGALVAGRQAIGRTVASQFLDQLGPDAPQAILGTTLIQE